MLTAVKPAGPSKSDIARGVFRRTPAISGESPRARVRVKGNGSIRAVISSTGDKALEAASPLESKESTNGSLLSSGGGIEVRATATVRKKMKEKLTEKIENQWEFFVNGFGQGILIHLISEEIDPG